MILTSTIFDRFTRVTNRQDRQTDTQDGTKMAYRTPRIYAVSC